MKTKRRGLLFIFLLIPAVLCIIIGEVGLYGNAELLEYAAPYSDHVGNNSALLSALDDLKEQLPDAQLSASVFSTNGWVQTSAGESTTCAITGVAPGWFDLYHHSLAGPVSVSFGYVGRLCSVTAHYGAGVYEGSTAGYLIDRLRV